MSESGNQQPEAAFNAALAKAQGMMRSLVKDRAGYVSKFVSTETVVAATKEVLSECGLAVVATGSNLTIGEKIDVENKNGVSTIQTWMMRTIYRVYHRDGWSERMHFSMAVVPEKGKPLDKAIAAASTFSLGYFLRGLLQIPRVGSEQEVEERDDRGFDPERLRASEITDRLARYLKEFGKERYEKVVGAEPPTDHESAVTMLALLDAERGRDGATRMIQSILKEMGGTDVEKIAAILKEHGLADAATLKNGPVSDLQAAVRVLTKAWKGE